MDTRSIQPIGAYESTYSGNQQDFEKARLQAEQKTAKQISTNLKNPDLFEKCLATCAAERQSHAQNYGQRQSGLFGYARKLTSSLVHHTCMIDARYKDYSDRFTEKISQKFQEQLSDPGIWKSDVSTNTSKFELQKISPDRIRQILSSSLPNAAKGEIEIREGKQCLNATYKANHPNEYKDAIIKTVLQKERELISQGHVPEPNEKTEYLLGIARLNIVDPEDGKTKSLATSQYLIRVDNQNQFLPVILIHQDRFLIGKMQTEAKKWFHVAISWSQEQGEEKLKDAVGRIVYCLSHSMPYARGSSAIIEWLEASLYRYHGFPNACEPSTLLFNLEALTSLSLEEFLESYQQHKDLGKKEA